MATQYEVLNPWAEVDPIPLRGISPRLTDLSGKRVGLFVNGKRASLPLMNVVERKLKERFATSEFIYFHPATGKEVMESEERESFTAWANGVDAVISAVGD